MTRSTDDLIRFVDQWRPRKIVVAGDFMLDRYSYGNAERLSPDAPVPVLAVERADDQPGGAANVCLDLRALGCQVACVGMIGRDEPGRQLQAALKRAGCDGSGLIVCEDRPTTVKHSFIGLAQHRHPQKMFRVDQETRGPLSVASSKKLIAAARRLLRGAAILCLEDYNKGVLDAAAAQALIAEAKKQGVPVLVDPAAIDDYGKYAGADCITPNRTEAALATGLDANGSSQGLTKMGRKLMRALRLQALVLTLDKQGALLLEKGKQPQLVPTQARAVYDVTGAGDMVLAMLAGAVANGADWPTAVGLANTAAGLAVEKFGTATVALGEVLLALLRQNHEKLGKLRTPSQLAAEVAAHRGQGKKIVLTNGCFDMLHAGHVSLFREARRAGDLLVVAINSDESIRRIKGPSRPVNRQADRILLLSELESIDYLIVYDGDTPIPLIRTIKPDVLVKGGEYSKQQVVGGDIVEGYGGKVHLIKPVKGQSTTRLIQRIADKHAGPTLSRGRGYVTEPTTKGQSPKARRKR